MYVTYIKATLPEGQASTLEYEWRTICYMRWIKKCEQLAKQLKCPMYHGQLEPSAKAKVRKY